MMESVLKERFNALDLNRFIGVQRRVGRAYVDTEFQQEWAREYEVAKQVAEDLRHGTRLRRVATLLKEISFGIGTLPRGEKPNYYQYTCSGLLDWYVEPELVTLQEMKERALAGYYYVLRDLLEFETHSLGGFKSHLTEAFDRERVHKRLDSIEEATNEALKAADLIDFDIRETGAIEQMATLEAYAMQPSRISAVIHFSCFPLTRNHDEVVFIRVLHGSEFCFLGLRACLISAIEEVGSGGSKNAEREIRQATAFARLLHRLLKILRTMPEAHFSKFRDHTGKASAIQSVNYHLLEIFFRGVNTAKARHFDRVDSLRPLLRYAHPEFVSLRRALMVIPDDDPIAVASRELDKQLLTWRGLHLSFAKTYIPSGDSGTGGTEGAAYLKEHLRVGLFDDTEPDMAVVREIFPDHSILPDLFRVAPRLGISPPDRMRTLVSRDPEEEERNDGAVG